MANFDASASALGFLHQIRWAMIELLLAAKRSRDETVRMTIEAYDDIALTDAADLPLHAVQLKQHAGHGPLTDNSPDLWKTLRVWLEMPSLRAANGPMLTLATTSPIAGGSAASVLTADAASRDVDTALQLLNAAAADSVAKATEAGRTAWKSAPESVRAALLQRVIVLGQQAHISDIDDILAAELRPLVPNEHLAVYQERLWGWWNGRAVAMLLANQRQEPVLSVSAAELHERMRLIRDQFSVGALVVDADFDPDEDELAFGHGQDFVRQLRWVKVGDATLHTAVIDYLRAYAHTTKWVQNGDLFDEDLDRYERDLKDEWSRRFHEMLEDLETDGVTDPDARAVRGRELFRELGRSVEVRIRPEFEAPFHARGTRNGIANGGEHGWHPDFKARLAGVLEGAI